MFYFFGEFLKKSDEYKIHLSFYLYIMLITTFIASNNLYDAPAVAFVPARRSDADIWNLSDYRVYIHRQYNMEYMFASTVTI